MRTGGTSSVTCDSGEIIVRITDVDPLVKEGEERKGFGK